MNRRSSYSKFGVRTDAKGKADRTRDGILFDSKLERQRYDELKLLERAGKIMHLRRQVPYEFTETISACWPLVSIARKRTYIADFVYYEDSHPWATATITMQAYKGLVVEDVKGVRTKEYREKKRWMEKLYGITIYEWPERPKKVRKTRVKRDKP